MAQLIETNGTRDKPERPVIHQGKTVVTLIREVAAVVNSLDHLHDVVQSESFTGNPYDLKPGLMQEKHSLLLELLFRRADILDSGISATLFQYPGEETHPFSQNVIEFNFAQPVPGRPIVYSELNRIGQEFGFDSAQIARLIGQPDETKEISAREYLMRIGEESTNVSKDLCSAIEAGDAEYRERLAHLKYQLVETALSVRQSLSPEEAMDIVMVGISPDHKRLILRFSQGDLIIIPKTSQLKKLAKVVGYDFWYVHGKFTLNPERRNACIPEHAEQPQKEA
jgi:hypothetical protein